MLDANRLRVLVEVARAGSISLAAERMSFTPPALSQQLTKLEGEVGCVLLERGRGGVALTEAGRVLLAHGERVLGELRAAEDAVRATLAAAPPTLALGAFASAGKALVPGALAAFRRAHPHARLALSDVEPPHGYGLVTSGDLDLLITHRYPGTSLPSAGGLHREALLRDPLLLVLPEQHPAAHTRPGLADLAGEEWISGAPGVYNRVALENAAAAVGVVLDVAYETRDYEVALALIRAGVGVGLVPLTILHADSGAGWSAHRPHDLDLAREIHIVHRRRPRDAVSAMVATLRASAGAALPP
ncbi:LysR family transcriptional regulator [Nocardiopsis ansamitocini]|uniref:LysR family transcriptional regulator n=1 Tax=Nocardiopsis ansamitocini TaxID=1670832 RepID=A0A9W6UHE0_9ACTN|nr:LysR family transcriptional regulator [Nocardiopsis ansamitocini]GLU48766.1 LysR family transcriptional regulator [Nocardiopsis ansamitocini]